MENWLDRMAVTLSFTPIAINQRSFEKAQRWNRRAVLMTAFIPPLDDGFLPKSVFKKIEALKTAGAKVFVTNASAMNYDRKGNEIYGIKFLIDFLKMVNAIFLCRTHLVITADFFEMQI